MYFLNVLMISAVVSGLPYDAFDLCLDYFLYRNVKLICVLDCEVNIGITKFTKTANSHRMLVTAADVGQLNSSRVEQCLDQTLFPVGVVLSAGCPETENTILLVRYFQASQKMLFNGNHLWLIIESNNEVDKNNITKSNDTLSPNVGYLETLNISVDADITVASKIVSSEYILYEVFNFGKIQGGDLIINRAGSWNLQLHMDVDINGYKYYRRWDFQQWQMRMIFVMSPIPKKLNPKVLTERTPTPGLTTVTKTSAMSLHVIAEIHNFRFKYTMADRWIGTFETNSTRVVANSLYFREQDVSPILRHQLYLYGKVDFINPSLTYIETKYYYRIPTKGPGKFQNQFLRPLSKGVWACLAAVSALCIVLLLMSSLLERRPSSAQYAVFSVIASICQQFFEDVDIGNSTRSSAARKLTILVTGLSCVLVYNYYTSSVVSWLLNGPPPSITSLQELMDSPLELLFEDVGYTRSWLQTPNYYYNRRNAKIESELRAKKVFKRSSSSKLLVPLEEGIAMVKAGGYAYHTEPGRANEIISRMFTQRELCELGTLQSMEKTNLVPGVQTQSPYKEFLVWSTARLVERGVVSCVQRRAASPSVQCDGSSPRALALGGAAPAFILLASGYGLATLIMFVERLIYSRLQNQINVTRCELFRFK
ncbi:ionotropic receptor 75a [Manduca sexta]|uniref:ionotropic receptor 75a n=1 Tax=Manduca sexta TaxID=7130 RepID=UPI00188FFC0B|nr:ionotropic receptor 75a [Manduca sexta]